MICIFLFFAQTLQASDWMQDFVEELKEKGVEIKSKKDLMRFLDSSKKANDWEVVQNKKLPKKTAEQLARQLVNLAESEDGKKIQVNFFEKAYFYGEPQQSGARKLASTPSVKADFAKPEWIELQSQFFYSRIEARDSTNGGSLRTSSKLNMGLDAAYRRQINDSMDLIFHFGGSFIGFETPEGANLEGESDVYFRGSGQISWQIDSFFSTNGRIGLKQLPYLTAFGTQVAVDQASHPYFGASLDMHFLPLLKRDLRLGFLTEVLNSSIEGDVNASSGVILGLNADYRFKFK
ncbi:MAG: hypothetical protein AAF203_01255, partial [Pseudomonadota bacterium]